jgi:hypothetical protein
VRRAIRTALVLGISSLFLATPVATAQEVDEPLLDELERTFKRRWLSLGVLFQTVFDAQPRRSEPGRNGFSIANMRLSLSGELDFGFAYFFQTNFASSPAILDAKAAYRLSGDALKIDAGLFKAPFSRELLTGAGEIDFVNRAQVVSALAPARQIGAMLSGHAVAGAVQWSVGVFNGNGFARAGNDNDDFLYVARWSVFAHRLGVGERGDSIEVALSVARSRDSDAPLGGFLPSFSGRRTLLGADVRVERGRWLASGEVLAADLEPTGGPEVAPTGFQATLGYRALPRVQTLARWDSFSPDGPEPDAEWFWLGLNYWPSGTTGVQVNYGIRARYRLERHRLLVNVQVSF